MAKNNILHCPHCGKQSKLIPIKNTLPGAPGESNPGSLFESISQSFVNDIPQGVTVTERRSFWASESVNAALTGLFAGGVVLAYGWWYEIGNGPIVAGVMLAGIVGLPVLKMWWYKPAAAAPPGGPTTKTQTLKIETVEDHQMFIDEITDRNTLEQLPNLGNALIRHPELKDNFSKAAIRRYCKIGGRRYDSIAEEFKRLNYAFVAPNNRTIITRRCQALLRKNATIPH